MVYRPPKNKLAAGALRSSRPSSDPLSTPPGHADNLEAALPGDDRNLVAVDENYSGVDFEDRLWLFWRRQGKNILRLAATVLVALIIWQCWNLYQEHALSSLQNEYQAAKDAGGLAAFAEAHPDATLGKLALLEAADGYYQAGKFKDAADAYGKAAATWGIDEKGQRARLGWGLSLAQNGDAAGAEQHLQSLSEDSTALPNYRAEAAFYNAVVFAQNGDGASAAKWIDNVLSNYKGNNLCAMWVGEASSLADAIPLMKEVKLLPTNAASPSAITMPAGLDFSSPPTKAAAAAPASTPLRPAATSASTSPKPPAATGDQAAPAFTGFDTSNLKGSSP